MDWENERYVRLYVRDTLTWLRLGWDGQNVLMQLIRKVDRAGTMELNGLEPWEAVVLACRAPAEAAKAGMDALLRTETVVVFDGRLGFPSFIAAQEAVKSDRQRQRESRERRALPGKGSVTYRDKAKSHNVTESHERSRAVTSGHSVLCSAVQNQPNQPNTNARARGFLGKDPGPTDADAPIGGERIEPSHQARSRALTADLQSTQLAWSTAVDELIESGKLSKAPALTHTHLRQAAEGAAGAARSQGLERYDAALTMARLALRTALERGRLDQAGFLFVSLDPWAPEGSEAPSRTRPGRIAPAPGTTGKDFEGVEDVDTQIERIWGKQ